MNKEEDYAASLSLYIQCFSAAGLVNNNRLDSGDKSTYPHYWFPIYSLTSLSVLLPRSVLEEAINKKLPLPLNFRVEKEGTPAITHCGVLEFDAPEGRCYLPINVSVGPSFASHPTGILTLAIDDEKVETRWRRERDTNHDHLTKRNLRSGMLFCPRAQCKCLLSPLQQLQPHNASWIDIPETVREAMYAHPSGVLAC